MKSSLSIDDQEHFMHRIFDVVHIGISFDSFTTLVECFGKKYDIKSLLNSRMKNEKYSESYDFPLTKVLMEACGLGNDKYNFYETKLKVIKYMIQNGAYPDVINEPYMGNRMDLGFLLMTGAINKEIFSIFEPYM
jgi:hypothetical protein